MINPMRPFRSAAIVGVLGLLGAASADHPLSASAAQVAQAPPAVARIRLTAGRSTVLTTDFDITRIAVTNPAIADAVVVQPREILVDGKGSGTVSLIIWGAGRREQYDVVVEQEVGNLQQQLQVLFPGEDIRVNATEDAIILSGQVSSNTTMLRAGEIAQATAASARVINMLQLPGGAESQQVILQVRFAEVNRRAMRELGVSLFTGASGFKDFIGRSTTQQFAAPDFSLERTEENGEIDVGGEITFGDFLNLFVFNTKHNVGALIKALQTTGFFQSLAEPNLIAYNGQEASFLAGGEIPIPVVQGTTGGVTVEYKEFGIRLNFRPTIAGDVIRLRVRPEVSTLDFGNGVSLGGFRVPALSTRRAETEVELRDGQSFVVAGLLDNVTQDNTAAIPLLSRLPIIGYLFRSNAERAERTELMVLITPRLVRALDPDEVPPLPTRPREFLPPPDAEIGSQLEGGGGIVDAPPGGAQPAIPQR